MQWHFYTPQKPVTVEPLCSSFRHLPRPRLNTRISAFNRSGRRRRRKGGGRFERAAHCAFTLPGHASKCNGCAKSLESLSPPQLATRKYKCSHAEQLNRFLREIVDNFWWGASCVRSSLASSLARQLHRGRRRAARSTRSRFGRSLRSFVRPTDR